ncbi:hypothetical protein LOD99_8617 [Oopsacas minuta]|uniref:Uncharacterized protein n=1 Tax=Oopsacas minuta TaxID=111878 RepID=A0AAV7JFT4_9METZ|nr:hypothetical protein LOD99_8617 [Oopsacas minuta]
MNFENLENRVVIKFLCIKGLSATETFKEMKDVLKDNALSQSMVANGMQNSNVEEKAKVLQMTLAQEDPHFLSIQKQSNLLVVVENDHDISIRNIANRRRYQRLKECVYVLKTFPRQRNSYQFSIHQPDGTYLEVPAKPKLQKDAVSRFLPGCPLHLSSSSDTIPPRFDRSLREQRLIDTAINESLLQYNQDKELFQITTLEDLVSKTKHSGLPNHWLVWSSDDNSFNLLKASITNNKCDCN